mgnify:CR=1 FL=1
MRVASESRCLLSSEKAGDTSIGESRRIGTQFRTRHSGCRMTYALRGRDPARMISGFGARHVLSQ